MRTLNIIISIVIASAISLKFSVSGEIFFIMCCLIYTMLEVSEIRWQMINDKIKKEEG